MNNTPKPLRTKEQFDRDFINTSKIQSIAEQKAQEYLGRSLRFGSDKELVETIVSAIKLSLAAVR